MQDYEIEKVQRDAENALAFLSNEQKEALWDYLNTLFALWKLEHGDRHPKRRGLLFLGQEIPFAEAMPWQCAGIGVSNNIDLAFKLWIEKYPRFMETAKLAGIPTIFATILLYDTNQLSWSSVSRTKDLLHEYQTEALRAGAKFLEPLAVAGFSFKQSQIAKAKKQRGKVGKDGDATSIKEIIGAIATSLEYEDLSAKELWQPIFAELEKRHLNPIVNERDADQRKWAYTYEANDNGGTRAITFGRFSTVVSEFRTRKKSR